MIQVALCLIGILQLVLTFQAIRDCILAEAYKAAWKQLLVMGIELVFIAYVIITRDVWIKI